MRPSTALRTPDFEHPPRASALVHAMPDGSAVRVRWGDGFEARFESLWMRENAPDPVTTHPISREPLLPLMALPDDLAARAATVDGPTLHVEWSTGDRSAFDGDWLRHRWHMLDAPDADLPPRRLWRRLDTLPRHPGEAASSDAGARAAWLHDLYTVGATVLVDLPAETRWLEAAAGAIGPIRETQFGRVFDVRIEPGAFVSNASTDIALPVHTDLATRSRPPGLQLLQCMAASLDGGDSLLVDGFHLVDEVRRAAPDLYRALVEVPFTFANRAPGSDHRHTGPTLELDHRGDPAVLRLSPWLRYGVADHRRAAEGYRALRHVLALAAEPARTVRFRLQPGEILCFDNVRMLHGRTALAAGGGERWLRGCYVDGDELASHLRMAARRAAAPGRATG